MCDDFLKNNRRGNGDTDVESTLQDFYEHINKRISCKKALVFGTHPLVSGGLIRFKDDNQDELVLTEKGKKIFLAEDIVAFSKSYLNLDRYSFVKTIYEYIKSNEFDKEWNLAITCLHYKVVEIESSNPQLKFISKMSKIIQDVEDRITFYMVCHKRIEGDELDLMRYYNELYKPQKSNSKIKEYKDEENILQKNRIVEIRNESNFFGDRTFLYCTETGLELFFEEDVEYYRCEVEPTYLLKPDEIQKKQLFFANELKEQLSLVKSSLQEESYLQLRKRLEDKSLARGIAVLLYGLPGTGKTESVLQIAKATG